MNKVIKLFNYCIIRLFSLFPIRENYIVLHSIPDYSDNAWAFYHYLIQRQKNKKYKIIWLVKSPDRYKRENNVRYIDNNVKVFWLRRDYYLAVSKYVVFTHSAPIRKWRKKQVFINTTHSASQLKASSGAGESNSRFIVPDYYLRCGQVGLQRMMMGLKQPKEKFVILGMPRLDLLFQHRNCIEILFPQRRVKKSIIALETFKQSKTWNDSSRNVSYGLNILNMISEVEKLDIELNKRDILLIIKPHPLQDLSYIAMEKLKNIEFVTDSCLEKKEIQLYELLENCDGLLTDYSSVYYDYLFLNRPIGFMVGDINEYKRGFIIQDPIKEMPGEIIHNLDGLVTFIENLIRGNDMFVEEREKLKQSVFKYCDNNNSKRLLAFIESK